MKELANRNVALRSLMLSLQSLGLTTLVAGKLSRAGAGERSIASLTRQNCGNLRFVFARQTHFCECHKIEGDELFGEEEGDCDGPTSAFFCGAGT